MITGLYLLMVLAATVLLGNIWLLLASVPTLWYLVVLVGIEEDVKTQPIFIRQKALENWLNSRLVQGTVLCHYVTAIAFTTYIGYIAISPYFGVLGNG